MKYMLLIYGSFPAWDRLTPDVGEEIMRVHKEVKAELAASGELMDAHTLSVDDARVVRRPGDDEPIVTDGPFAEVSEVLAGYYLIDCADIERATEIAARLRETTFAPVEIRRLAD